MSDTLTRDETVSEAIAGNIREVLARKRVTQSGLARMLGRPQQYISRRLTGDVPFDVVELVEIADYLEVPLERLLDGVKSAIKRRFSHSGPDLRFLALAAAC